MKTQKEFEVYFDGFGIDESQNDLSNFDELEKTLIDWCNETIALMQKQFDEMPIDKFGKRNGRSSGDLRQSFITLPVTRFGDKYEAEISTGSIDYWAYLNYGVRGALSDAKAPNSPFKYRDKMPPLSAMEKWGNLKGYFTGLDEEQKEKSMKSMQWSIYTHGIKPRPFVEPVLTDEHIQKLIDKMTNATSTAYVNVIVPKINK